MAVKYKVVSRSSFMSVDEIQQECKGGYELISHAAWAYDASGATPKTYKMDYIFAYMGGVRGNRSVHGGGH